MKQAAFLGALAVTGSVRDAALRVGMSRETAYRLRRKPGAASFAAAWDAVLRRSGRCSRKVTPDEVPQRALHGLLKPVISAGRHIATVWKSDNSALLRYMAQLSRAEGPARSRRGDVGSFTTSLALTSARVGGAE